VLLSVHNLEEAVAFRYYLPRMASLLPPPFAGLEARLGYSALLIALLVVSCLAFAMALATSLRSHSSATLWALLALEATVGLNAVAHVVSAVVLFRGYGPGLITAVVVNLPFAWYCFRRAAREHWVSPTALRATVPAALILHGPILIGGLWLAGAASR
jgi:hypothetical protein